MGILRLLRKPFDRAKYRAASASDDAAEAERYSFAAEIPAGSLGAIWSVNVQVVREPQHQGDRLRLRAHMQSNLASVLRPALQRATEPQPALKAGPRPLAPASRAVRLAGRGLQHMLATPLAQRLAAPLLRHDFNTWLELQASTEPLDDGAHSLVLQHERLAAMGIRPKKSTDGPAAESWSSQTAEGYAQLSMVQIDKHDLPPELARRLGPQPFQLAAAIASTVERK